MDEGTKNCLLMRNLLLRFRLLTLNLRNYVLRMVDKIPKKMQKHDDFCKNKTEFI